MVHLQNQQESVPKLRLEKIIEKSIFASMDETTREEYFAIYKREKDRRCEMATATRIGREEGERNARIEAAKSLKSFGIDPDVIAKSTRLSKEQIESL